MSKPIKSNLAVGSQAMLSKQEFQGLGKVPPAIEWLANIENEKTQQAYKMDIGQFTYFLGIEKPDDFRQVKRAHIIAWRDSIKNTGVSPATVRRKMSALSSLFDYLCEKNSIEGNPVNGVKRPTEGANVGKTPALSYEQAKKLFNAPPEETVKGLRDRAILATFLHHAPRKMEVAQLRLKDIQDREGIKHFTFHGKRGKIRYVAINPVALKRIDDYLKAIKRSDPKDYLFTPINNRSTQDLNKSLSPKSLYDVVLKWGRKVGIDNLSVHALRATSATLALKSGAEIVEVQEWLGHSDISTTRMYDKRRFDVEDSPSFKVNL